MQFAENGHIFVDNRHITFEEDAYPVSPNRIAMTLPAHSIECINSYF